MRQGIRHRRALVRVGLMLAVLAMLVGAGVAMRVQAFSAFDVLWTMPRP
jgi:hypothetical protein